MRGVLALTLPALGYGCAFSGSTKSRSHESDADARPAAVTAQTTAPGPGSGSASARATETSRGNDYRIFPADTLDITVFQEPDLKSTVRVSNEGTIVFPLVGVVPVGGLTPQAAAEQLRDRLAQGYLVNPQVTLTVREFSKRRFTVLGEVQKPGSYDMPDQQDVTVLQAIGMAGGYTRIANPSKITLMRNSNGQPQKMELNARQMARGNAESALLVQPGDVITVAESRF